MDHHMHSSSIKLGLFNANIGSALTGPGAAATARLAEEVGLESLWVAEHLAIPARTTSKYPYSASGKAPIAGTSNDFPDPLVWLSFAAAATTRIKLATGVMIAALRHPLINAKQIATLDTLSGGRVILGVGVGWLAEEYQALDVFFSGRGALLESHLEAMREL